MPIAASPTLAAFTNSDFFQVGYPLLTIPVAAWYARRTERRAAVAPLVQVQVGGPFLQPAPQPSPQPPAVERQVIREKVIIKQKVKEPSDDENWWVIPLVVFVLALAVFLLIARGYAATRGTLLDVLLGGGVFALGITVGTYLGLRRLPTFTDAFRLGLGAAALTELLAITNAYLLLHPSWTQGGSYEQAFDSFLRLGPSFSEAYSDKNSDVTFFLAYQGIGAFVAILALAVAFLCTFSISGQVERNASSHIGHGRRLVVWGLDRLGGGQTVAWGALLAAFGATAFCSGVLYNLAGSANFELPASPAVSGLSVAHTKKRVTAHFRLDGRATVTVQVRRLAKGQAGRPLNQVSRKLARGPRRITLPARKDGGALRKGIYRVRVRAETTGGERSVPRIADFRVK